MKSITNHLYRSASSSRGEDGVVVQAKWNSVVNHIQNVHSGHGELYHKCEHGPLEPREWLKKVLLKLSIHCKGYFILKQVCPFCFKLEMELIKLMNSGCYEFKEFKIKLDLKIKVLWPNMQFCFKTLKSSRHFYQ